MATYSQVPANTAEATRDLQDRLARFARWAFIVSSAILLASISADVAAGAGGRGIEPFSRVVQVVTEAVVFVAWRVCRGKPFGLGALGILDAALTIGLCFGWALFGLGYPAVEPIELTIMLATTYTLIGRSVLVPSSFARSFWISAAAVVPTVFFFARRGMPFVPQASAATVRAFIIVSTLWCVVAVCTAAYNSRQLYGLRERIREVGKLGQYTLEEKIGEGGMGVVYRAAHAMLRRPAAIKLLLPDRSGDKDLARFEREVQLTSRLSHPNTISIFDYGRSAEGVFYYVMEYLDGLDLQRIVEAQGALEPPRVVRILTQAASALAEAHALGLVHRDIKPANMILTERADEPDIVKVVDFGLVKTLESSPEEVAVTQVNTVIGTPMCLAPEAITTPEAVDARADLYSLGAVGYFILTGRQVFEARTIVEMCSKHLHDLPVPPSQRVDQPLPADLEGVIMKCLAKRPEDRPASAEALLGSLRACADASRYDIARARAWWRDEAPRLRALSKRRHSPDAKATTMAIDLSGRSAQK
jgi:serine/threonine-protein kinase